MKQLSKPLVLTAVCALGGLLCLLLRQWLFAKGMDSEGLPLLSHPANILIWVITGGIALVLIFLFFTWEKHVTCAFPLNSVSGLSTLLMACGYATAAWQLLFGGPELEFLTVVATVLALLSLLCMLLIALGQFRRQRMHPLLFCPGVLFFLCYLILSYPGWSGEPQPQVFFFQMMASSCMLITIFCRAELAAGKISGRNYLLFSRAAVFTSIAAISHTGEPFLYLLFALTLLLDGCSTEKKEPKDEETPGNGE